MDKRSISDYGTRMRAAGPLRDMLYEARQKCEPPMRKNTGMSVCRVHYKDYPYLSVALMIKARPDKIPEMKECIRLSMLFYAVLYGYINPEGAADITDPKELDEVANKLEQIQKSMVCEHNIVKLWRFIRDKRGTHTLDGFLGSDPAPETSR